nr:hypothetical protein [Rhizobium leguminosarum]
MPQFGNLPVETVTSGTGLLAKVELGSTLGKLVTIDATDAGSEEISPKNRTSPFRAPFPTATEILSLDISKPMKIKLSRFVVRLA